MMVGGKQVTTQAQKYFKTSEIQPKLVCTFEGSWILRKLQFSIETIHFFIHLHLLLEPNHRLLLNLIWIERFYRTGEVACIEG